MKNSVNVVILSGRLGKDPESSYSPSGKLKATFSMAVSRHYKVGEEAREETSWVPVEVWGATAEKFVMPYVKKGDEVLVEGKLSIRKWEDNGATKYWTSVNASSIQIIKSKNAPEAGPGERHEVTDEIVPEDDIPF